MTGASHSTIRLGETHSLLFHFRSDSYEDLPAAIYRLQLTRDLLDFAATIEDVSTVSSYRTYRLSSSRQLTNGEIRLRSAGYNSPLTVALEVSAGSGAALTVAYSLMAIWWRFHNLRTHGTAESLRRQTLTLLRGSLRGDVSDDQLDRVIKALGALDHVALSAGTEEIQPPSMPPQLDT